MVVVSDPKVIFYTEASEMAKRTAMNCSAVINKAIEQINLNSMILEQMNEIDKIRGVKA